jgi:hypothetical protein
MDDCICIQRRTIRTEDEFIQISLFEIPKPTRTRAWWKKVDINTLHLKFLERQQAILEHCKEAEREEITNWILKPIPRRFKDATSADLAIIRSYSEIARVEPDAKVKARMIHKIQTYLEREAILVPFSFAACALSLGYDLARLREAIESAREKRRRARAKADPEQLLNGFKAAARMAA